MPKIEKNIEQLNAFKEIENDLKVLARIDSVIGEAVSGFQIALTSCDSNGKSLKYTAPVSESVFKAFLRQQAKGLIASIQTKSTRFSITLDEKEQELCKKYTKEKEK